MPSIPVANPLGYIGVFLVITGFFLVIAGIELIKIEKLTITPGKKTWGIGLLLAMIGLLFLWPDIHSAISSSPEPTAVDTVVPNTTSPPTGTSMISTKVQPTSVNNIALVETPTLRPFAQGAATSTSLPIACITSQTGSGVPAEVQTESLTFSAYASFIGPKLPLANGDEILFSNMRSFDVIAVSKEPYDVRVTITLFNGDMVTEDVRVSSYNWDDLEGETKYGSFSIPLSDVKRVEFREQDGCQ